MTVKITKPAINVREELNDLKKPTGVAGEAMLRAETPEQQFNLIGAGRRNLVINGDMRIAQRGTSGSGLTTNEYTLDRMWIAPSGGTYNWSQEDNSLADHNKTGFHNFLRINFTTGDNNAGLVYKIEFNDYLQLVGKKTTVSFYAKGTMPASKQLDLALSMYDLSTYNSNPKQYIKDLDSDWKKYTFTFDELNTNSINFNAASGYVEFYIVQPSTDNSTEAWTLDITGLQIEAGPVATPFEHRPYVEELALCKRYFQNVYNGQCFGSANTSTRMRINAPLSPEMRANPTVARVTGTISFQGMGVSVTSTSTTIAQSSPSGTHYLGMDLGGFSGLTGRSYAGSHSRTLVFTADAEL